MEKHAVTKTWGRTIYVDMERSSKCVLFFKKTNVHSNTILFVLNEKIDKQVYTDIFFQEGYTRIGSNFGKQDWGLEREKDNLLFIWHFSMMSNFFIPSEYKTFLKINMLKADKEHGRIKKREKRGPLGGRLWHVLAQDNLASAPFI